MWLVFLLLACGQAPQTEALPDAVQRAMAKDLSPELGAGRRAFREHCQACHGPDAGGDGPAAAALEDRPGDLAITTRDPDALKRSIRRGVSGTAMQGHDKLDDGDLEVMVAWLAGLPAPALTAPAAE